MDKDLIGCVPYLNCEQKGDCPVNAQAIMEDPQKTVGMTLQQLQRMPICLERSLDSQQFSSQNSYQRAAFLLSTLWDVKDTINISFMSNPPGYPGQQPAWEGEYFNPRRGNYMAQWYTKSQVNSDVNSPLTPEEEAFEIRVRAMDPKQAIQTIVMEKIQPFIGLKLVFTEEDGDIRISFDNRQGASSVLGIQCRLVPTNEPTMTLGWLDVTTIIHEFCHALGMIHEHQNPFGKGIDWNIPKVVAWIQSTQRPAWDLYTICTNIFMKYNINSVNGSNYDPYSIMLYSYPPDVTNNNQATYRNIRLSEQDKLWLSNIYPQDGSPRKFPTRTGDLPESASKKTPEDLLNQIRNISILGLSPSWSIFLIVILVMVITTLLKYFFKRLKKRDE
jgi:hypothetical protein